MTGNIFIWSFTIGALFLIFLFRRAQKFRNESHHHPLIEWDNNNDIHYEEDEDENDAF